MSLPTGTILGQRYEIRAFIGSDGTLDVYKALDLRLGRDVALTVLELLTIQSPEELIGFEREAQIRATLHHPRIMTIHDFGHGANCAFQVAEWLDGQSLRRRFKDGPLPWAEARNVAEAVLEGLAVIHHRGYTLRTLDTSSVFLQRDGHVKLFAYQLKSLGGGEFEQAELEGLRSLARTLSLVLDAETAFAEAGILRGMMEAVGQDAPTFRKHFEELIHGKPIQASRPLKRHWLAGAALVSVLPVLAVLGFRRLRTSPLLAPAPVAEPRPARDPEARRLYLQAMTLMESAEPDSLRKAQSHFQSAIAMDPAQGLALSGLGKCYALMGLHRILAKEEARRLSQAAIQQALALDRRLGAAHAALAFLECWYDLDWPAAEKEYRLALYLEPGNVAIHRDFGSFLAIRGRWEEGLQQLRSALERDPLSRSSRTSYAVCLHWAGRSEEALQEFAKSLDQEPASQDTLLQYRDMLDQLGRIEESLQVSDRLVAQDALSYGAVTAQRTAYEARGLMGYRRERVRQAERRTDQDPLALAELVALQGDRERAFRLLGRALREKSVLCARLPNSPALRPLRSDPRFGKLLKKLGYPETAS